MDIKELSNKADNIIELANNMKRTFNSQMWDDCLRLAIMAGLKDAHNAGAKYNEESKRGQAKEEFSLKVGGSGAYIKDNSFNIQTNPDPNKAPNLGKNIL